MVRDLKSFTGASDQQAVYVLQKAGWNAERAADLFYQEGMMSAQPK